MQKFDVVTGTQSKAKSNAPSYTSVFAKALIDEATRDERVVAITAAMPSGTGLDKFAERFPDRSFDVGIAEQHAVTFAAGLAADGLKPFAAIYSTFLLRAYDQIVLDVVVQKLPVRFATGPDWSAPMAPPMPAVSISVSSPCRGWSPWPPPTRPNWCIWWPPPGPMMKD